MRFTRAWYFFLAFSNATTSALKQQKTESVVIERRHMKSGLIAETVKVFIRAMESRNYKRKELLHYCDKYLTPTNKNAVMINVIKLDNTIHKHARHSQLIAA